MPRDFFPFSHFLHSQYSISQCARSGTRIAGGTASFRIGQRSGSVCTALEEVVEGMQLGDTRRCRAPPQSSRGRALTGAPPNEILEYDVTLTGIVQHMRIITLDERDPHQDDPLLALVEFGKRQTSNLARKLGLVSSSSSEQGSASEGGRGSGGESK